MPSLLPTPVTVQHRVWSLAGRDAHNRKIGTHADAVTRGVFSVINFHTKEVISADVASRAASMLEMAVPEPSLYRQDDWVILNGTTFRVIGIPTDDRRGPLPLLNSMLGGMVRMERVT